MPFFTDKIINQIQKIIKTNVTLQVRIILKKARICRKRVLRAAYGSITIEAAFVFPLFLFVAVLLLVPMKVVQQQRLIQLALETAGEEFSQTAYGAYFLAKEGEPNFKDEVDWIEEAQDMLIPGLVQNFTKKYVKALIDERMIKNISFSRSEILEDGEHFRIVMDYQIKLPFSIFRLPDIEKSAVCYRRAWIGREGGKNKPYGKNDDVMVFVGKNSTRYHKSRECHYLFNNLKSISIEDTNIIRNQEGRIYRPCHTCAKHAGSGIKVYIMPSGLYYHVSPNCFSIISYVQEVPLSKVKYLGACSYCSKE